MENSAAYTMKKTRVKLLTSTKAKLLEESINLEVAELEKEGYIIESIQSNISYTGEKGSMAYMILCQITYIEKIEYNMEIRINHDENPSRKEHTFL